MTLVLLLVYCNYFNVLNLLIFSKRIVETNAVMRQMAKTIYDVKITGCFGAMSASPRMQDMQKTFSFFNHRRGRCHGVAVSQKRMQRYGNFLNHANILTLFCDNFFTPTIVFADYQHYKNMRNFTKFAS